MRRLRVFAATLLGAALVSGTLADRPPRLEPLTLGGYRVLAADFHTHSSMWSDGALTPWGLVLEARRQALDVIAVTGHNATLDGQIASRFAQVFGGPIVIAGEEILSDPNRYHLVALGIHDTIGFDQTAAQAIAAVHRQGGVAIAVHPVPETWPAFDAEAIEWLDAAEICHPLVYEHPEGQRELEAFAARGSVAAIGSSDFHGTGRMGLCRTFVFVREATAAGVLDALRAHRTIVFGRDGKAHGDPSLVRVAANDPRLLANARTWERVTAIDWISRLSGIVGLAAIAAIMIVRDGSAIGS